MPPMNSRPAHTERKSLAECDLIMRGGVTSGIVFPKAITRLAQKYRFRSIGGTSAGAIAAAFAAAAEYGGDEGFRRLATIPDELGRDLAHLFQPARRHAKLFKRLKKWSKKPPSKFTVGRVLVWNIFRGKHKQLAEDNYGFCPGTTQPGNGDVEGLTDWLNRRLEWVSGRIEKKSDPLPDRPLTFGMLKGADGDGICLRMITTCLSQGRPYTLPLIGDGFRISSNEAKRILPANVRRSIWSGQDGAGPVEVPGGDDMPIILAVRMSLSFPLLFTAVKLQTRDFSRRFKPAKNGSFEPKSSDDVKTDWYPCLFSDGGLSSNFPIHMFDSPIPNRPTFGISLTSFNPERHDPDNGKPGSNRVYLPMKPGVGQTVPLTEFEGIAAFAMSILDAARNWQDSMLMQLPGYRERIVRVALNEEEGGLNLDMDKATIDKIANLGDVAAGRLTGDGPPDQLFDFNEHRWRRWLATTNAIDESFRQLAKTFPKPPTNTGFQSLVDYLKAYEAHLNGRHEEGFQPPGGYDAEKAGELKDLRMRWEAMAEFAAKWNEIKLVERWDFPKPTVGIRMFPQEFVAPNHS